MVRRLYSNLSNISRSQAFCSIDKSLFRSHTLSHTDGKLNLQWRHFRSRVLAQRDLFVDIYKKTIGCFKDEIPHNFFPFLCDTLSSWVSAGVKIHRSNVNVAPKLGLGGYKGSATWYAQQICRAFPELNALTAIMRARFNEAFDFCCAGYPSLQRVHKLLCLRRMRLVQLFRTLSQLIKR